MNRNYIDWHKNFLQLFWDSKKSSKDLLDKMINAHPSLKLMQDEEKAQKSIIHRMKNYGRGLAVGNYERSIYLDDIYALCEALNISPNDIFLSFTPSINFIVFGDVYSLLQTTFTDYPFIQSLGTISVDRKLLLPQNYIFRNIFYWLILREFRSSFREKKSMSYGKTPAYSKRYEANFQSKESNSDAEILIQLLLDFKEKIDVPFLSHRKLKNHIMQSFSSTIWTYQNGAFEDDDTEFEDENGNLKYINDFSNFWTVHKQIDITINFFILKTLIHSLRLYYQTFTQGEKIFNSVICIKLIKEFPELTMIFCELFKHIIIPINQYLFITWDMTLLNFESYDDIKKSKINYVKEKKTSDISIETIGIENIKATTYESSYK